MSAPPEWEAVVGLEVHAHLKTRTKMFCRCALEYGAAENTHTCPVCLAHPGALPVAERQGDRAHDPARPRARLRDRRPRGLRAQELLLSRPAEGLPDQPVRGPSLRARRLPAAASVWRPRGRDRSRPPRGGCGEDRPRGRGDRPVGRRLHQPRRLQPRRHAAARDRHRAAPALGRGGDVVPAPAPPDDRRARGLRRGDGEGHPARGRERQRPPDRGAGLPAALGDQEHELVHVHRPRDRGRRPPAGRRARGRRDRLAVDLRLRPRHRPADRAPLEGGGGGLPLLPRARPRPGRAARRARRAAAGAGGRASGRADPADRGRGRLRVARSSSSRPAATGSTTGSSPRARTRARQATSS